MDSQPRASAAVVLVRPAVAGIDVFMVRRAGGSAAFADAWVFPGGVVEPQDDTPLPGSDLGPAGALAAMARSGDASPAGGVQAAAIIRAALRELFEEAGVLLATGTARPEPGRLAAARAALHRRQTSFARMLGDERIVADARSLTYFSHWITPTDLPRRYDTRFFVAVCPPDQRASHCGIETTAGEWLAPAAALARNAAGGFPLVFPTWAHLRRLAAVRSVAALLADAASKAIRPVQPALGSGVTDREAALAEIGLCW